MSSKNKKEKNIQANDSFLEKFGVYGWDGIEDVLMASIAGNLTAVMFGNTGSAKTYVYGRVVKAMNMAATHHGIAPIRPGADPHTGIKLDGHASQDDEIWGFGMPPSPGMMERAISEGESPTIVNIYSKHGVAFANSIMVDEFTRIPQHHQNSYLPLMDEARTVRGLMAPAEFIWASANPLGYAGTHPMDQALANRVCLLIDVPEGHEMDPAIKRKAYSILAKNQSSKEIKLEDALEFWETIQEARRIQAELQDNGTIESIVSYMIAFETELNSQLTSYNSGRHVSLRPLDTRRCSRIIRSISWVEAVRRARGIVGNMKEDALEVVKMSMIYKLTDEAQEGQAFFPTRIQHIHEKHSHHLQSPEQTVMDMIHASGDPFEQVALSFNSVFKTPNERSLFVRNAIDHFAKIGEAYRYAFSCLFIQAYINRKTKKHTVDGSVIDLMISDYNDFIGYNEKDLIMNVPMNASKSTSPLKVEALSTAISDSFEKAPKMSRLIWKMIHTTSQKKGVSVPTSQMAMDFDAVSTWAIASSETLSKITK